MDAGADDPANGHEQGDLPLTGTTTIQLDSGDGYTFAFELACDERAGAFLRPGPSRWVYYFTNLGLAYAFEVAHTRRWVIEHLAELVVETEIGHEGERHVVVLVPYEIFLREIRCAAVPLDNLPA